MALPERKKTRIRGKIQDEVGKTHRFIRLTVRFFIGVAMLLCIWYGSRMPFFTIQEIVVEGGETISHDDVRIRAQDALKGTYFFLIPKTFIYLYPHDALVTDIEEVPRAHEIAVSRIDRNTLRVTFEEYIPHALVCPYTDTSNACYFIDTYGYAFASAPELKGGTFIRHSIEGVEEPKEGIAIDASKLAILDSFMVRVSDELGFRIMNVIHELNGDISFVSNGGGTIVTSGKKDYGVTFENLKSVLDSKEFKHLAPGNFNYIDVRFDNKIFVNEELGDDTASTTGTTTLPEA